MSKEKLKFQTEDEALQHLANITGKNIKVAAKNTLNSSDKNKINKGLSDLSSPPYYSKIPLDDIFEVLGKEDIVVLQEDGTEWSGMLVGKGAETEFDIAPGSSIKKEDWGQTFTPFDNAQLRLSWHKMESGNYEIVVYIV